MSNLKAANHKALSLKSLVGIALQDWGSDRSWEAISALQMRGSPEFLAMAHRFAKSHNYRKRALGLYIASQLRKCQKGTRFGSVEYALGETQSMLLAGLHDMCSEVLYAAISGLGHRPHPSALPNLIQFSTHPDQQIRFEVAVALAHYSEAESIDALLRLATDRSDAVRDWATFGIGSMHEVDNTQVRELLWTNLKDSDENVRGEALVGLAIRKDERIIQVLLELLDANCRVFELNASKEIASPLLLERLHTIKNSITDEETIDSYWYRWLSDAIEACSSQSQ